MSFRLLVDSSGDLHIFKVCKTGIYSSCTFYHSNNDHSVLEILKLLMWLCLVDVTCKVYEQITVFLFLSCTSCLPQSSKSVLMYILEAYILYTQFLLFCYLTLDPRHMYRHCLERTLCCIDSFYFQNEGKICLSFCPLSLQPVRLLELSLKVLYRQECIVLAVY